MNFPAKFAICNELFEGWEFDRIIRFVKKTGYDGIELAPYTFADSVTDISLKRRQEIRKIAQDEGLTITGLHWLLVKPSGLHITHPDPVIRRKTVDYIRYLVDFCGDIGGSNLIFGSPKQRQILEGISHENGREYLADGLLECSVTAASRGVVICLEALPESLTNFLNTNLEILKMVQIVNHPNIRMMLDVKSMFSEPLPVSENIVNCKGYIEHFHANDPNLRGPGFGEADFTEIFKTLLQIKYEKFISVEVFDFSPDPETIAVQSLLYMQKCWEKAVFG